MYDASIALNEGLGDSEMVGVEYGNKAWLEISGGNLDEAERLLRESFKLTSADAAYAVAFLLLGLARVELQRERAEGAEALGAAEQILERDNLVWDPAEEPEYRRTVELARRVAGARLGELRMRGRERDPQTF